MRAAYRHDVTIFSRLRWVPVILGFLLAITALAGIPRAGAQEPYPVWDTAWELPNRATLAEADTYMAYISSRGYDGIWMSYLNQDGITGINANGHQAARLDGDNIALTAEHAAHVRAILDIASGYGLDIVMVAAWGSAYLNTIIDQDGSCELNTGPLHRENSRYLGEQLGAAIGDHPALSAWMLGGDNWCDRNSDSEDARVWSNMKAGIRSTGSNQTIGYHTGGWRQAVLKFIDEPWIETFAVQTSHCRPAAEAAEIIGLAMERTDKPVVAAEMRYEAIEPPWCDDPETDAGPGRPVSAADVLSDAKAAFALGTDGYVFGHNERWLWGGGDHGSTGKGFPSVQESFFAPGEQAVLDFFGRGALPDVFCNAQRATIIGNAAANTLLGTPGDDVIVALGGNDVVHALGGNDIVCGGDGADLLDGGKGGDILLGEAGNDKLLGSQGSDRLLRGGDGNDVIVGGGGNDTIYGDAGKDKIKGSGGNDVLWGGADNDNIKGNGGNDTIYGDDGNDRLDGNGGADRVNGGAGNDKVIGGRGTDTCEGGSGRDKVHRSCESGR